MQSWSEIITKVQTDQSYFETAKKACQKLESDKVECSKELFAYEFDCWFEFQLYLLHKQISYELTDRVDQVCTLLKELEKYIANIDALRPDDSRLTQWSNLRLEYVAQFNLFKALQCLFNIQDLFDEDSRQSLNSVVQLLNLVLSFLPMHSNPILKELSCYRLSVAHIHLSTILGAFRLEWLCPEYQKSLQSVLCDMRPVTASRQWNFDESIVVKSNQRKKQATKHTFTGVMFEAPNFELIMKKVNREWKWLSKHPDLSLKSQLDFTQIPMLLSAPAISPSKRSMLSPIKKSIVSPAKGMSPIRNQPVVYDLSFGALQQCFMAHRFNLDLILDLSFWHCTGDTLRALLRLLFPHLPESLQYCEIKRDPNTSCDSSFRCFAQHYQSGSKLKKVARAGRIEQPDLTIGDLENFIMLLLIKRFVQIVENYERCYARPISYGIILLNMNSLLGKQAKAGWKLDQEDYDFWREVVMKKPFIKQYLNQRIRRIQTNFESTSEEYTWRLLYGFLGFWQETKLHHPDVAQYYFNVYFVDVDGYDQNKGCFEPALYKKLIELKKQVKQPPVLQESYSKPISLKLEGPPSLPLMSMLEEQPVIPFEPKQNRIKRLLDSLNEFRQPPQEELLFIGRYHE